MDQGGGLAASPGVTDTLWWRADRAHRSVHVWKMGLPRGPRPTGAHQPMTNRLRNARILAVGAVVAVGAVACGGSATPQGGDTPKPTPTQPPPLAAPWIVQVENLGDARPQAGLSTADVVYEYETEGGISRFS